MGDDAFEKRLESLRRFNRETDRRISENLPHVREFLKSRRLTNINQLDEEGMESLKKHLIAVRKRMEEQSA